VTVSFHERLLPYGVGWLVRITAESSSDYALKGELIHEYHLHTDFVIQVEVTGSQPRRPRLESLKTRIRRGL